MTSNTTATDHRDIEFVDADEALRERIERNWGLHVSRHLHIDDGFTIAVLHGDTVAGVVSVKWCELPLPFEATREAYIDIIEVAEGFRRQGIGARLVELSLSRAKAGGACQVRAWSTNNRRGVILMWRALGFVLCPTEHMMWGPRVTGYFVARRLE